MLSLLDRQLLLYSYGCRRDFKTLNTEMTVNTKSCDVLMLVFKCNDSNGGICIAKSLNQFRRVK